MTVTPDLSVIIITYNEEKNLTRCLQSLPVGAEVVIVDSFSTDNTLEIAKKFTAHVYQRKFGGYSDQKNTAMTYCSRNWILAIDADEVVSPDLQQELIAIANGANSSSMQAYRLARRLVFNGKLLKFGKSSDHPIRLFRRGSGQYVGEIHEHFDVPVQVTADCDKGHLLHYSYESLNDYFKKFNDYTSAIAQQHLQKRKRVPSRLEVAVRFFAEFFVRYIIRLGILDGYAGFLYALISSFYAFIKYAKFLELAEKTSSPFTFDGNTTP